MKHLLALVTTLLFVAGCTSSGGSADAGDLVSKTSRNAHAFARDTSALVVEVFAAIEAADDSALYGIATDARELRGHVDDFYDEVTLDVDLSDDDQSLMLEGLREVRAGIGTIQRWVDKPSPSLTDRWEHELETGIGQWNHAVKAIWSKANVSDVPTIDLPSS